jgi:hypothetical protein
MVLAAVSFLEERAANRMSRPHSGTFRPHAVHLGKHVPVCAGMTNSTCETFGMRSECAEPHAPANQGVMT